MQELSPCAGGNGKQQLWETAWQRLGKLDRVSPCSSAAVLPEIHPPGLKARPLAQHPCGVAHGNCARPPKPEGSAGVLEARCPPTSTSWEGVPVSDEGKCTFEAQKQKTVRGTLLSEGSPCAMAPWCESCDLRETGMAP